jgi:hypothetical protein
MNLWKENIDFKNLLNHFELFICEGRVIEQGTYLPAGRVIELVSKGSKDMRSIVPSGTQ